MILMYHKIYPESPTAWWVTVNRFWSQMEQLRRFDVVSLRDYQSDNPRHAVITFDGCYENVFVYAFPILKKFGYPFELFVVGDSIGASNEFDQHVEPPARFCSFEQLKTMVGSGGRLQWHSKTHQDLSASSDRRLIEMELAIPPEIRRLDPEGFDWFAYPHGRHSATLMESTRKFFSGAVSCADGNNQDRYQLNRVTATNETHFPSSRVSLIIPNFNYGRFLAEAIESALLQTVPADEILFIDDCSIDNSIDVAQRYQDRIRIVRNETNLGIVDNFNRAVSLTSGDYICFLGADNRFRSDYIEKCKLALDLHDNAAVAYTDAVLFGPRAEVLAQSVKAQRLLREKDFFAWQFPDFNEATKKILKTHNFIHGSSMFRRKAFDAVGGYKKTNLPEDHNLFTRMVEFGWDAVRVPELLLEYRQHSSEQANTQLNSSMDMAYYRNRLKAKEEENVALQKEVTRLSQLLSSQPKAASNSATEQLHRCARSLAAEGQFVPARAVLESLIQCCPRHAAAHHDLASLYCRDGDKEKTRFHLEKAVSLDPAQALFLKSLAAFHYVTLQNVDQAVTLYERVLSLLPEDVETLSVLGNLSIERRAFVKARAYYLEVLSIDPANKQAEHVLALLDSKKLGLDADDEPSMVILRARRLARNGATNEAIEKLKVLLKTHPQEARAHNDLGNLLCLLQKPDEALDHLEQAVRLAPGEVGFLRDLADAHLAEAGDIEKALALYNKALALKPDDIETLLRIGNVCAAKGLHNDARFFYDKVLAIEPCHAAARENVKELEKMVSSRPASRKPATIFERCKQLKREGTHNESVMILEDLIAYHFEQRTLQDARSDSHSMSDRIGSAGRPKGTAAVLQFHNAQASSVKATDRSDSPQTNKRLNQAEIQQKKTKIESLPVMVEIASTNVCNILPPCVQCWKHVDPQHGFINKDARHIPERFLTHLAPHIRLTEIITLHGAGEPLTCTYIFDAVQHVHPLTRVGFTSNGLLLTDHNIDKILQSNIHFIDFSIDAASPETYRKIRHNDFNRLLDNIKNLIKKRDESGRKHPEVRINMCLMLENMSEIPAFIRLGKELDAAVVHLFHMNEGADYRFDWFNYKEQHCRLMAREHDEYVRAGFSVAEHLGVNVQFSGRKYFESDDQDPVFYNKTVDISKFWCAKPWDSMLITLDGDIYNCCWQTAPIGTLRSRSFEEIWNEKLIQDIRQSTLCGIPHRICDNRNSPCPFLGRA